ncbi:MAG: NADH-quinone oxidoreductase subunit NuoG [Magnetospiraceae bacterium]
MPKLTIDGTEIEVDAGLTVLQACEEAGVEIPRFCYHERLSIAGNCRMCLVEMERAPKLIASCAMPVAEGMVIKTNSPKVKEGRAGVMEFLLVNHPLDCPICDQGGECDLQDQAQAYGQFHGRFQEMKRTVPEKDYGPLIRAVMTRCIHCTRCIRFCEQVAGTPQLGGIGRGEHMEVTDYVGGAIASEMSGNLVDICPVGALTSIPYQFHARPWELTKTQGVDVFDAVGANIRIDTRGNEVMRVMPRINEDVNEEWLADKSRFAVDGLKRQRLDKPYLRKDGKLAPASWDDAFAAIAEKLNGLDGKKIGALVGDQADAESMFALKELMTALGSPNLDCRQDGAALDGSARAGYLFNSTIAGIDEADVILLVGTNPRWEAPVINTRIRGRYLRGGLTVGVVGAMPDLNYKAEHLGDSLEDFSKLANGRSNFAKALKDAERPMVILGTGPLTRPDGAAVLAEVRSVCESLGVIKDGWNGFNVLQMAASRVAGLDMGFVPGAGGLDTQGIVASAGAGAIEAVYLLGADEIDMSALGKAFVIYQGHHGDAGAHRADVVLPGAAYTEKNGTWVNTEGRVQRGLKAAVPPGEAREDWAILRALSGKLGKTLPYDSLDALRAKLVADYPTFATLDTVAAAPWESFGTPGDLAGGVLTSPVLNYYQTDPISRVSPTMAACTAEFVEQGGKTGTDG